MDRGGMPVHPQPMNTWSLTMEPTGMKQPSRHPAAQIPRLFWTLEETAARLGLSVRSFFALREKHPLYAPDGSRTIIDDPKKDMPL